VDGTAVPCKGIFFAPGLAQASSLPEKLRCSIMPGGEITMGKMSETTVPGVYVAGDAGRDGY
jgi:thioredoxin reductase